MKRIRQIVRWNHFFFHLRLGLALARRLKSRHVSVIFGTSVSSDRNQPAPDSEGNRFGAGGSSQFVQNRADVELGRMFGDT